MTAINQFATLISAVPCENDGTAIGRSCVAFIHIFAGMFAGSTRAPAQCNDLWTLPSCVEQQDNLAVRLEP